MTTVATVTLSLGSFSTEAVAQSFTSTISAPVTENEAGK